MCATVAGLYVQISGRSDTPKAVKLPTSGTLKDLKAAVRNALRPLLDGKASACHIFGTTYYLKISIPADYHLL